MSAPGVRDLVWRLRRFARRTMAELRLELLRHRLMRAPDGGEVRVDGLHLRITDGANTYMQYKDEFVRHNYAFITERDAPVVIDGGANMGMFTLATLREHPHARITAFEPDPALLAVLRTNLERNGAGHVTLVNAALGAEDGEMGFTPDGQAGGMLVAAGAPMRVRVERLSRYLDQEVDFLKLNIEGAELEVLRELRASGRIALVRAMVIEYHGWPGGEQRLGPLLSLLDESGFRYLVNDQDEQSNPRTQPPFRPPGDDPWFALVYAWRVAAAGAG
ncbi:MAG: FkbM family methyltransferase [Gemmatimonadales bacterium]